MKKLPLIVFLFLTGFGSLDAQPIDIQKATLMARSRLISDGMEQRYSISGSQLFDAVTNAPFYLFRLHPCGYVIVPAIADLPPVLAYSYNSNPDDEGMLISLVKADLSNRVLSQSDAGRQRNQMLWDQKIKKPGRSPLFQQWPEAGTTATGGWLETNWTQNSPYNLLCPMDLVTGMRSIAGCPAVAMAQIVNFHQTTNGVHFTDEDDYHHAYAGRNYMIDDDYLTIDFPSFPMLNGYLDTLQITYQTGMALNNRDKAALTFACGIAAHQVFTSSASGTFGVDQAAAAYLKFNFDQVVLLTDQDTNFYNHMAQNIKDTLPVHLAVVDPAWSMGHNVVVDGYNTDDYYHLNFGWGGSNNGWYLLPEEIPYGLTVIEGAVLDIIPDHTTGLVEQRKLSTLLYPNPANRILNVENQRDLIKSIEFYTMDGRLIRTHLFNRSAGSIDISGINGGVYIVKLLGQNTIETHLLLVDH